MKLLIDIEARFAQVLDATTKIEKRFATLSKSFHGITPTIDVAHVLEKIKELASEFKHVFTDQIDKADELGKLSQKIGISVTGLSGLEYAAKLADVSIESLTIGVKKLSTNLVEAQHGAGEGAKLFAALKLDPKQFDDTEEVLLKLADRFSKMPDGAEKAALAVRAFGRSGIDLVPLLNAGAKGIEKLTAEAKRLGLIFSDADALAAQEFNDNLKKIHLQSEGIVRLFVGNLLPVFSTFTEKLFNSREEAGSLTNELRKLTSDRERVLSYFETIGRGAARLAEVLVVVGRNIKYVVSTLGGLGDVAEANIQAIQERAFGHPEKADAIIKQLREQQQKARKAVDEADAATLNPKTGILGSFSETLDEERRTINIAGQKLVLETQAQAKAAQRAYDDFFSTKEGKKAFKKLAGQNRFLPDTAALFKENDGKDKRDQVERKALEERLKLLQHDQDAERELAQTRNDFLQHFYQQDLVSLGDYSAARQAILQASVKGQTKAINAEIEALQQSKPKDEAARIDNDIKINDLIEKRKKLALDANIEEQKYFLDNDRAARDYAKSLQELNVQLLELQGRGVDAAPIRFDLAHGDDIKRLYAELATAQKDFDAATTETARTEAYNRKAQSEAALTRLDEIKKLEQAQAEINRLEDRAASIRQEASATEERINIAVQQGRTTEVEGLTQIDALRKQESEDLKTIAHDYEVIANSVDNKKFIDAAKQALLETEKLAASADSLRDKYEAVFTSSFGTFFEKLASGTVTVKDAVKGLLKDIAGQFFRFGSESFVKQIFSPSGSGGGIVDTFKTLFSGQAQSAAQQAAAPISTGTPEVATSLLSATSTAATASKGAEAATALSTLSDSTTATTFALKEFSDNGLASATGNLFENVAATTVENTASQNATGSLATLAVSAEAAASALASMAATAAVKGAASAAVGAGGFAEGGVVSGAGTSTSDSIPVLLSNNEFVIRAKSTKERGAVEFLTRFNKAGMSALKKFSAGGLVGKTFAMPYATNNMQAVGGAMYLTQNFAVQANTPRETQQQFASAAYQGGARAFRRNR